MKSFSVHLFYGLVVLQAASVLCCDEPPAPPLLRRGSYGVLCMQDFALYKSPDDTPDSASPADVDTSPWPDDGAAALPSAPTHVFPLAQTSPLPSIIPIPSDGIITNINQIVAYYSETHPAHGVLDLSGKEIVRILPDVFTQIAHKFANLRVVILRYNPLEELAEEVSLLQNICYLDLRHTNIKKLPESLHRLGSLSELYLSNCRALKRLPAGLALLPKLNTIDIAFTNIHALAPGLQARRDVTIITNNTPFALNKIAYTLTGEICDVPVEPFPVSGAVERLSQIVIHFYEFAHGGVLDLSDLGITSIAQNVFQELRESPFYSILQRINLKNNFYLTAIPQSIGLLKNLHELDLTATGIERLPDEVGALNNLTTLNLFGTRKLRRLPASIRRLHNLKNLSAPFSALDKLPTRLAGLISLEILDLSHSRISRMVADIIKLRSLSHLYLHDTPLSGNTPVWLQVRPILLSKLPRCAVEPTIENGAIATE